MLIILGSESGKTNTLLNTDKYQRPEKLKNLYIKDPFKSKYQFLINRKEKLRIPELENSNVFVDNLQTIDDVYESLEDYNLT